MHLFNRTTSPWWSFAVTAFHPKLPLAADVMRQQWLARPFPRSFSVLADHKATSHTKQAQSHETAHPMHKPESRHKASTEVARNPREDENSHAWDQVIAQALWMLWQRLRVPFMVEPRIHTTLRLHVVAFFHWSRRITLLAPTGHAWIYDTKTAYYPCGRLEPRQFHTEASDRTAKSRTYIENLAIICML